MKPLVRTIFGVIYGSVLARLIGLLGRLHGSPVARRATRRTFVRNATLGATGILSAITAGGFVRLLWPNKTGAFGSEVAVPSGEIPEVDSQPYLSTAGKFYLVHNQDGLLALYTKCPHLGCTVPWVGPADSPQAFQCPCHGSMYDYNGVLTGGPAPRPMDLMAVKVEGGNVTVDTGDIRLREDYEPSQAVPLA